MNLGGYPAVARAIMLDVGMGEHVRQDRCLDRLSSRLRALLVFLAIVMWFGPLMSGEPAFAQTVGSVTRVEGQAQVGSQPAAEGVPVGMNAEVRTGPASRIEVTFQDGTKLTLGENARVRVDRYVFNPAASTGAMALTASRGALRFATGQIGQMQKKDVTVSTPAAALAVRGTEFWAGIVDLKYGVLLLSPTGRVNVRNRCREVTLGQKDQGTDIAPTSRDDDDCPSTPYIWPADKVARALAQTSFGLASSFGPSFAAGLVPLAGFAASVAGDDNPPRPISP